MEGALIHHVEAGLVAADEGEGGTRRKQIALGEEDELGVEVGGDGRIERAAGRRGGRDRRGQLLGRGNAARFVTGGLRLRLRDEEVHLGELGVEVRQVVRHPPRQLGQAGRRRWRRRDVGHRVAGRGVVVDQSSGIRIQPWRMA
jgi:hypothetical protein